MKTNIEKKIVASPKRLLNNLVRNWRKQIENNRKLSGSSFISPARISERKDAYSICIYKPGLKPDSLATHLTGDLISVRADKEQTPATTGGPYYNSHFFRCFSLPANANKNRVHITYHDGIVKVIIYKKTNAV